MRSLYRSSVHLITIRYSRFLHPRQPDNSCEKVTSAIRLREDNTESCKNRGFQQRAKNYLRFQSIPAIYLERIIHSQRNQTFTCYRDRMIQGRRGDVEVRGDGIPMLQIIQKSWRWHRRDCARGEEGQVDNQLTVTFRRASHCFRRETIISCLRVRRGE